MITNHEHACTIDEGFYAETRTCNRATVHVMMMLKKYFASNNNNFRSQDRNTFCIIKETETSEC